MVQREYFRIRTDSLVRDPRIEEMIVYHNRQEVFLYGMLIGLILIVYAVLL
jgi:hypothetical protein